MQTETLPEGEMEEVGVALTVSVEVLVVVLLQELVIMQSYTPAKVAAYVTAVAPEILIPSFRH